MVRAKIVNQRRFFRLLACGSIVLSACAPQYPKLDEEISFFSPASAEVLSLRKSTTSSDEAQKIAYLITYGGWALRWSDKLSVFITTNQGFHDASSEFLHVVQPLLDQTFKITNVNYEIVDTDEKSNLVIAFNKLPYFSIVGNPVGEVGLPDDPRGKSISIMTFREHGKNYQRRACRGEITVDDNSTITSGFIGVDVNSLERLRGRDLHCLESAFIEVLGAPNWKRSVGTSRPISASLLLWLLYRVPEEDRSNIDDTVRAIRKLISHG